MTPTAPYNQLGAQDSGGQGDLAQAVGRLQDILRAKLEIWDDIPSIADIEEPLFLELRKYLATLRRFAKAPAPPDQQSEMYIAWRLLNPRGRPGILTALEEAFEMVSAYVNFYQSGSDPTSWERQRQNAQALPKVCEKLARLPNLLTELAKHIG